MTPKKGADGWDAFWFFAAIVIGVAYAALLAGGGR